MTKADAPVWIPPPTWMVPREWTEDHCRCFILCGGESVQAQRTIIPKLKGRFIVVKHGVHLRPAADVLFLAGEHTAEVARELIPLFRGTHIVVRGKSIPSLPASVKRVSRDKDHDKLSALPDHVSGRDAGTSAINLAYHFGATEIVMIGYDMLGGHWCPHPMQYPPEEHFIRHMEHLPRLAEDAKAKGIRIINASPISRVQCFERRPLESFLKC